MMLLKIIKSEILDFFFIRVDVINADVRYI